MKSEKDFSFLKTKDQSSLGWFLVFYLFIVLVFVGIGPKTFSSAWDKGYLVLWGIKELILNLLRLTRFDIFTRRSFLRGKVAMDFKRIKLIIESKLENVPLIGITINKLSSLIFLSDIESYKIELCVVEAVTNSIKHAYGNEAGQDVEVVFTLYADRLTIDVCDTGKPLDQNIMNKKNVSSLDVDLDDIANLPEGGRGIAIIKEIMDTVSYKSEKRKNVLTMAKRLNL